jgi:predicted nucleic acid-binding protein
MPYLVDTNILLRYSNTADVNHALAKQAVDTLLASGERLHYTQQNRREFWNVCTRPTVVHGLGLTVVQAVAWLHRIDSLVTRLPDVPATGPEWDRLVTQYQVIARAVHDAQLVASMIAHGITHILTLNVGDFARYAAEVTVVHPQDV